MFVQSDMRSTKEYGVLLTIIENFHISTGEISLQHDISETYYLQLHQKLMDDDYSLILVFCKCAQQQIRGDRITSTWMVFGDDAFHSTSNPYSMNTHSKTRLSINVWVGIVGDQIFVMSMEVYI